MTRHLLPPQVRAIRAAIKQPGATFQSVAIAHGTIACVVANIARGRAYADVPDTPAYTPNPVARKVAIEAMLRALKRRGLTQGAQYWAALADLRDCEREIAAQMARAA